MQRYFVFTACLALLIGLLLAPAAPAGAFCIYNKTDQHWDAQQASGGRIGYMFFAKLGPHAHACCNWKNKDCNKEGHRDSILHFNVQTSWGEIHCYDVRLKAGGYLNIEGKGLDIKCKAHD